MKEEATLLFIQDSLKSVWALEMLLLLHRDRDRGWRSDQLVRELRGSEVVVSEAIASLRTGGLIVETPNKTYKYGPSPDDALDTQVNAVATIYATHPMTVIKAITGSPNEKLRIFSDAFKLRDK